MRRTFAFAAIITLAGCGGHTPAPAAAPVPAARASAPAEPRALQYAASTGRYRVESQSHIVQEMMGQSQEVNASVAMTLSTALTLEGGNVAAAFTVDSIAAEGPQGMSIDAVRGRTYRAVYTTAGRPISLATPDTTNPVVTQIGEMFREFLPTLPPSAIAAGMTWTDTVAQTTSPSPGLTLRSQSVRQHRVVGWEDHGGVRALHISTSGNYTLSGEGEQQGQQLQLSGTGATTVERFVSAAGVFLGQTVADSTSLTVNVMAVGMEIPIHQTRHATVTRLP
jgi:hypothetical protein